MVVGPKTPGVGKASRETRHVFTALYDYSTVVTADL